MMKILDEKFYTQSAFEVAPSLVGKIVVHRLAGGEILRSRITETEIYYGTEDTACHARFGKTKRNAIMYERGGYAYIYLCYGVHYLLNVITGAKDHPEGVLIRACENFTGPGKATKNLQVTTALTGHDLTKQDELWIEDDGFICDYITKPRVGIDYAGEPYKSIPWRFVIKQA